LGSLDDVAVTSRYQPRVRRSVSIVRYLLDSYLIYDTNCDILKRAMCPLSLDKELK
jgi:hypothetical protein